MKEEYCFACENKTANDRNGNCAVCGQGRQHGEDGEYVLSVYGWGYVTSIGHAGITYSKKIEDAFIFPNWESVNDAWDALPVTGIITPVETNGGYDENCGERFQK